jgi:hypothetical protein
VNIADYPIVDVSSEKPDGNPAHFRRFDRAL